MSIVKQGSQGGLRSARWLPEAYTWRASPGISQIHTEYTPFAPPGIRRQGLLWFEGA
uniref:Uncharacterized protein n=1 Tax=Aegilops tauschii subsp. strangulata TaxID=200361 RepID=A0A453A036_AEGTS